MQDRKACDAGCSVPGRGELSPCDYRVVALGTRRSVPKRDRRDRGARGRNQTTVAPERRLALISVHATLERAVLAAENFRGAVIAHRKRLALRGEESSDKIHAIFTEQWIGSLLQGGWRRIGEHRGGFYHTFRPAVRPARRSREVADCLLLPEKTRKGGWLARLVGDELVGPITNSEDVPRTAKPGQRVRLRIGAISRRSRRIQFHWMSNSHESNARES